MAKYVCKKFKELGFYVNGTFKRFHNGEYNTTDKKEIAALDVLSDVEKVEEPPEQPPAK
ncbi:hypothetical protein KYB31_15670 [Clostridium felsineum]|uniref:hypothetical protein n=1 Tax=Clostridium felsineum TaxID=36839 RepID=UPI00214DEEF8|nr:hypothetical protein [Clostridium felsineum]MCR3760416.1 hypothetical protein [Clostridium felsineum]